jgi:serine/threonine protein kinase
MAETELTADDLTLDPWVGHVLSGRYRLVAAIGAGGMGVVYRAWDLANDGYVVVKMPKRELLGEPKFLQRFEQELSALRALSHPAVVPVIDVGNEQGTPYAVMPYLAGGSLKQRRLFTQEGQTAPEAPANLWRWLPAVAKALDFVHSNGYVHRDVKPDNILFDGPGTPFLSDFGVAKIVLQAEDETASRGLTGTGLALGTPAYMAPELISGTKPSPQVDQYALAVTVYELLAARKPFDGPTPAAVILAHVTGKAPALASLLPVLPPQLSEAVARGMAREPADRFGSCVEFASAALAAVPRPSAAEKLQLMCPQCSRLLNVKPDWAGKQGNCPRCKSAMAIGADLKSLWLQGDRLGTPPASETVPVRVLGPTPSLPVAIPKPTRPTKPPEPESVMEVLKEQFLGSQILKAAAGGVVALCAIFVALPLVGVQRLPDKPRAITRADAAGAKKIPPKPNTASETEARVNPKPPDQDQPQQQEPQEEQIAQEPTPMPAAVTEPRRPRIARGSKQMQMAQPVQEENAETGEPSSPLDAEPATVSAAPEIVEKQPQADLQRPAPQSILPVPPDEKVAKVIATFREAYEDQYASAKETGRYSALTGRLETVLDETQDPAQRYALLVEAEELGVTARDLGRAMGFLDKRIEAYEVDPALLRLALIKKFATQKKAQPTQELFDDSLRVASQAVDRDDFEVAQAAGQLAISTAKALDRVDKSKSAKQKPARGVVPAAGKNQTKDATEILNTIRSQKKLFDAYEAAIERLADEPDAEDANAVVGRYLCLTKRDWNKGLPSLAKGPDDQLRKLAQRELAVQASGDVSGALEAAGAWWDFMESKTADLTALELAAVKDHAGRQYAAQLEKITDPTNRALAEKRAADVSVNGQKDAPSFAALIDGDNEGQPTAGGKKSDLPVFAIVPEPRGLSKEIYPLLPTAEEIKVISNHLTLPDNQVYQAIQAFSWRLRNQFSPDKWSDVDAKFIIALNDAIQLKLGKEAYYREWECARIASMWLLGSPDELEFVRRARTVPQNVLDDVNSYVTMRGVKEWLLGRTAQFPTDKDKAAALDRILQAGFRFRGITEFRAALQQQQQQ